MSSPPPAAPVSTPNWLALVVGNTRLHWAAFAEKLCCATWHTPHLTPAQVTHLWQANFAPEAWAIASPPPAFTLSPDTPRKPFPLVIASVVPSQTALWQAYPYSLVVELADLPLKNLYATLGIDRALSLLGASDRYGWPVLVVDAGTALTFTAGAADTFIGGAILPGLALQSLSLHRHTAALPRVSPPDTLLPLWAQDTETALQSGLQHSILATIQTWAIAWQQIHPQSPILLTGGDAPRLHHWLRQSTAPLALLRSLQVDLHLAHWGLSCWYCNQVNH